MKKAKPLTAAERKTVKDQIAWIQGLSTRKKTTEMLGTKLNSGEWKYCCLGVACRTLKIETVDFSIGDDRRVTEGLELRSDTGAFDKKVKLKTDHRHWVVGNLVNANDELFKDDTDFRNMRPFILLTINRWCKSEKKAAILNRNYADEIAEIKSQLGTKYDWKILK